MHPYLAKLGKRRTSARPQDVGARHPVLPDGRSQGLRGIADISVSGVAWRQRRVAVLRRSAAKGGLRRVSPNIPRGTRYPHPTARVAWQTYATGRFRCRQGGERAWPSDRRLKIEWNIPYSE